MSSKMKTTSYIIMASLNMKMTVNMRIITNHLSVNDKCQQKCQQITINKCRDRLVDFTETCCQLKLNRVSQPDDVAKET